MCYENGRVFMHLKLLIENMGMAYGMVPQSHRPAQISA